MKLQTKQSLAWLLALAGTSALFGGGSLLVKKMAHGSDSHDITQEDGHSKEHDDHEAASDHGAETASAHSTTESPGHSDGHKEATSHHAQESKDHKVASSEHESSQAAPEHKNEEHAKSEHAKPEHAAATSQSHEQHQEKIQAASHHETAAAESKHGTESKDSSAHGQGHEATKTAEHGSKPAGAHANSAGPHWSYLKGDAGAPNQWGSLSENFAQCEKGREQSPIDLKGAITKASSPKITWSYNPVAVNVENNGHTVVANMPNSQNHITIDGEEYSLAQFHFHNPSEHKIGGIPSDMELHFVHKNAKGGLAVIGVMLNEKANGENPFLKPLWQVLPREAHAKADSSPTMNLTKLLPVHRDYFHYAGSLTTPPCSQGVRWFVLKEPVSISGSQADLYAGIFGGPTNRPIQPLFGREVIQSVGPASVAH